MDAIEKTEKVKTVVLPSGVTAVIGAFKGSQITQAQKIINGESERMQFALIALTTEFDGVKKTMEEVEQMDGWDCLKLMALFAADAK